MAHGHDRVAQEALTRRATLEAADTREAKPLAAQRATDHAVRAGNSAAARCRHGLPVRRAGARGNRRVFERRGDGLESRWLVLLRLLTAVLWLLLLMLLLLLLLLRIPVPPVL